MSEAKRAKLIFGMVGVCLTLGTVGCANPGIPKPPSLRLPAKVTDLTGVRVGDRVELHWTGPSNTTDGQDLTGPTTVEICRDPAPTQPAYSPNGPPSKPGIAAPAGPCTVVLSTTGHPGESTAVMQLAASLIAPASQQQLMAYRIRVLNSAGRSAPPSSTVLVPGGPAPINVAGFQAKQQKSGVVLQWFKADEKAREGGKPATVEVQRTLQTTHLAAPVAKGKGSKANVPDPFARTRREGSPATIKLEQDQGASAVPPPSESNRLDGMIDQSALQQETYTYTAQRVLKVPIEGRIFEIRSEPTSPISITMRDTFPPMPPRGLISVLSTIGPSTAQTGARRSIDLAWEPNAEADLAGYIVYRTDLATGKPNAAPVRLTPEPLPGPAYRDTAVISGHRYLYRVTAVDLNGNESIPSGPVEDAPDAR